MMGNLSWRSVRQMTALLACLVLAVSWFATRQAGASHQPANKTAAVGSTVEVMGPGERVPVLTETMRVSSQVDLMLQLTAECDILTQLTTGGSSPSSAESFGQVRMWVEIDGTPVPVSSAEADDPEAGKVVFCNRAHDKTVTDAESPLDGTDREVEGTRTRQANGFNWVALDIGFDYDDPALPAGAGNNVVEIVVYAELTETAQNGLAEALIQRRTLIVEPTMMSVHEST